MRVLHRTQRYMCYTHTHTHKHTHTNTHTHTHTLQALILARDGLFKGANLPRAPLFSVTWIVAVTVAYHILALFNAIRYLYYVYVCIACVPHSGALQCNKVPIYMYVCIAWHTYLYVCSYHILALFSATGYLYRCMLVCIHVCSMYTCVC